MYDLLISVLAELVRTKKVSRTDILIALFRTETNRTETKANGYYFIDYLKPIPADEDIIELIKNITIDNKYLYPIDAKCVQPMAAQPTFQIPQSDSQRINEELAKMASPKAAEFGQSMAAQPNYSDDYQHKSR